jgi:uncharacterized protein (DUF1499 family)
MKYRMVAIVLVLAVAGWALTMALLSLLARRPENLGVHDDRLAPCSGSPNCVCSFDDEARHAIEPIAFADDPDEAWARLEQVLSGWPRTQIVRRTDTYLHAECTSWLFRFVDDVEFLLDRDGRRIHCRSASRAGRSDLGVNRTRLEAIRRAVSNPGGGS